MTKDASIGVVTGEIFQQLVEGVLLGLSAGVGRMALLIEASLIDDAKGTPVVAFDMDALDALREQGDDVAIASDIPVIGYLTPLLLACIYQGFYAEGLVAAGSNAVYDEILHNFKGFHSEHELEPMWRTALYSDSTQYCCDNRGDNLEHLFNGRPLQFHFEHGIKLIINEHK